MKLILASSSPRRRDILKQIGLDYEPLDISVDETIDPGISPEKLALDIAKRKAIAASASSGDAVIIAADTIVVLEDGTVLGKPQDVPEAVRMLERLQGAKHTVITAIALLSGADGQGQLVAAYDKTHVTFLPMSGAEIDWYVSTGEPLDKAGVLEKQFRHYFRTAERAKGVTGVTLLQLLERRLDNVVFRVNIASSRSEARELVQHGLVYVNNKRVDIPSYTVKVGEEVSVKPRKEAMVKALKERRETLTDRVIPKWLDVDKNDLKAKIVDMPKREDVGFQIQEQLIIELYSK